MLVTRWLKISLQYWLNRERGHRDERKDRGYSIRGSNGGNKEKEWSVVPKTSKKAKWGLKSLSMSYSDGARDPVKIYSSWFWGWKTKAQWLPSASITLKLLGLELKTFQQYPDSCQLDVSFLWMWTQQPQIHQTPLSPLSILCTRPFLVLSAI